MPTPNVIYEDGAFTAFVDNQRLQSFDSSQDAWQYARAVAFRSAQIICPICNQVRDDLGRCGCDYGITHELIDDCDVYRCGDTDLWLGHIDPTDRINVGVGERSLDLSWDDARRIYLLLSQPRILTLMGLDDVATMHSPLYQEGFLDGFSQGRKRCATSAAPVTVESDTDSLTVYQCGVLPCIYHEANGHLTLATSIVANDGITRAELRRLRALLNDPRTVALIEETAPVTSEVNKRVIRLLTKVVDAIEREHPDDQAAQAAALHEWADLLGVPALPSLLESFEMGYEQGRTDALESMLARLEARKAVA